MTLEELARMPNRSLERIHRLGTPPRLSDLAGNDFGALFTLVETAPDSYVRATPYVYAFAAGRSFFDPIFPNDSLALGWSAIAVHWLSAVPSPIPDHIYCSGARGAVRAAFAQRAAEDWERFLSHRADELRGGGQLVVVGGAAAADGKGGAEGLMDAANGALRSLVEAGVLRPDEYLRMNIPTYNRTLEEFTTPLLGGPLAERFTLEEKATAVLPDAFWPAYERSGDARAFAGSYAGFLRAFTESALRAALDSRCAHDERQRIVDAVYDAVRQRIEADPVAVVCAWQLVLLRLGRK